MKNYYQVNMDVDRRRCLIVGGDDEALEKIERLHECRAVIHVVAKKTLPAIDRHVAEGHATCRTGPFEPADVTRDTFLVMNCVKTEPALSQLIFDTCRALGVLICSYDQPQFCDFTMPGLVRAGRMRIAVSSGASSPGLSGGVRKGLEQIFDGRFNDFVETFVAYREKLAATGLDPKERKRILRRALAGFTMQGTISYPTWYATGRAPNENGE
ncbi:MAG: bifunctional precorrin-2 dehydrogenase/sirohydrochlorin ferrochelatase [Planctomycetes bacterium]|nr:bifunctional precorrin-2 dehydrogenase/sirohydrochlorin ferrochelatase [Planctomycetota bacterium]